MGVLRAITLTVVLTGFFVASAGAAFVYLVSGYPSPEVEAFTLDRDELNGDINVSADVLVNNIGGEGDVVVEFRVVDSTDTVVESTGEEIYMARNEERNFERSFNVSRAENVEVAVFAPGRPQLIQDRDELMERLPEPDDYRGE